jgi:pimeloyl-ACP methyl ester carboxylesterase
MQVLDAGDGYRIGYRAPFMYDDETAAVRLTVPTKLFYREEDVLVSHLERLPVVAADVSIELVTGGPDALAAKTEAFFEFRGKGIIAVDAIQKASSARAPNRSILSTDWGELGYRVVSGNGRNAVVCLHDIGTPAIVPVKYDRSRVTLIPDLPGHGTSRDWPIENCSPEHIASALLTLIDNLELEELSIVAIGGSCAIGVRLAQKLGRRLSRISLSNPMPLDSIEQSQFMALLPDTTPTDTGAHLLAAWNYARMRYLFCPWQLQNGDAAQKVNAPAPRRVHRDMIEILRAGKRLHTLWQKCFGVNLSAELSKLDIPMELNVIDNNEHVKVATRLVHALGLRPNKNSERGTQSWQK